MVTYHLLMSKCQPPEGERSLCGGALPVLSPGGPVVLGTIVTAWTGSREGICDECITLAPFHLLDDLSLDSQEEIVTNTSTNSIADMKELLEKYGVYENENSTSQ